MQSRRAAGINERRGHTSKMKAQPTDMYRCMLNKAKEQPRAVLVPLEEYKGPLSKYVRLTRRPVEADTDPGASFVLFHGDLVEACKSRGVLAYSDACDMWAVVERWCETCQDDAEDDDNDYWQYR